LDDYLFSTFKMDFSYLLFVMYANMKINIVMHSVYVFVCQFDYKAFLYSSM
jgi:hypothetical protein